jgi:endonuclease-3 related protein
VNVVDFKEIYKRMMQKYGPQGWWPLLSHHGKGENPTKRGVSTGYHKNDFSIPEKESDIFEVMIGAILTQNTSWIRAEAAIIELNNQKLLSIEKLEEIPQEELAQIIKTSGYYNQKAIKIKNLIQFLKQNSIAALKKMNVLELREKLLEIKGVGKETADSIILYALQKPIFVIDAYTKRLFSRFGFCELKVEYDELQKMFDDQLEKSVPLFNEYHALIVQHCVHVCLKKPKCVECIFNSDCKKVIPVEIKKKKITKENKSVNKKKS